MPNHAGLTAASTAQLLIPLCTACMQLESPLNAMRIDAGSAVLNSGGSAEASVSMIC